ncbi:hypothetical protein HanPI659440_Chr09g0354681 [Helianthus annuus]|nr:hypothetical protein HanPI659440_Chr09g0354681 [Helianthus annuus]
MWQSLFVSLRCFRHWLGCDNGDVSCRSGGGLMQRLYYLRERERERESECVCLMRMK